MPNQKPAAVTPESKPRIQHSSGPWARDDQQIKDAQGNVVAFVYSPADFPCFEPETEAEYNAALEQGEINGDVIAASTDLLAALLAQLRGELLGDMNGEAFWSGLADWFPAIHAKYPDYAEIAAAGGDVGDNAYLDAENNAFNEVEGFVMALRDAALAKAEGRKLCVCRACGCTNNDCRGCIERTGQPCYWVEADLCSACVDSEPKKGGSGG